MQTAARIDQAEAELDAAQVTSGYSKLVSPIDGVVVARHADPGMLAAPGTPLLAIEDDRTYELEVAVEESRIGKIVIGEKAGIEIDALQGAAISGRVREIVPSSDPSTRTYTVKIQIMTAGLPHDRLLRSGLFGKAFFAAGDRQGLVVPESALIHRGQLEGVYIVENSVALLRLVRTGKQYEHAIEILAGLAPGARIVVAPTPEISDGVKVIDQESSRNAP
jgi:RND family efflux transporter MFP subunit